MTWSIWTVARTKDSNTKKPATTNHSPPSLCCGFRQFGGLGDMNYLFSLHGPAINSAPNPNILVLFGLTVCQTHELAFGKNKAWSYLGKSIIWRNRSQPFVNLGVLIRNAETPVLWPPHEKSWLIGKDFFDAGRYWGQEEKGTTEDEMAGWHHRLDGCWVWVNSGSWWWTGRPGVLQFMGLWRVRHDWATELNWTELVTRMHTLPGCTMWDIRKFSGLITVTDIIRVKLYSEKMCYTICSLQY